MTPNEPQESEREPLAAAPDAPSESLPFEYQDLTDARHQRIIEEIKAARRWSLQRRAMGLPPN